MFSLLRSPWFKLAAEDVPDVLAEWMEMLYPDGEWKEWYVESNEVYGGKTPQEALSIRYDRDPEGLRKNVEKMVDGFYHVLAFVSVPYVASPAEVYNELAVAQQRVINSRISLERERRIMDKCSRRTPPKLFLCPGNRSNLALGTM